LRDAQLLTKKKVRKDHNDKRLRKLDEGGRGGAEPANRQVFASYNNPKGNADTELVMRTIKEDLVWPNYFESPFDLQPVLDKWINDCNTDFPHSSIGYRIPCEFEQIELSKIT
jgi:transposase InsO family protein